MKFCTKRLLVTTVDEYAKDDPSRRFALIPRGSEVSDGFQEVSMKDLAQAVNFMCWWIENTIGPAQASETLAYMGANDARYFIFILACQKTGYRAFLPSTRNSDDAQVYLLETTHCTKFFFSEELRERVTEIQGLVQDLGIFLVPTIKTMLDDESGLRHYPYFKSYDDAENDILCIVHSSGTTGMPKLVHITNGFAMTLEAMNHLPNPEERKYCSFGHLGPEDMMLGTTPNFHLLGLVTFIFSVWLRMPLLIRPEKPLSVDHMVELLRTAPPTVILCAPSLLEDMSHSEDALIALKAVREIRVGGASMSPEIEERLRRYTQIIPVIGASETSWLPFWLPEDPTHWEYYNWVDSYGLDMRDVGDGVFELVITREANARDFKGIFHTYPDINEYPTRDLFTQHPEHPHLWKYYGRQDDVVALSNGEKFTPVGMESIIEGHPLVGKAVVVGQGHFQAALLIEPSVRSLEVDEKAFIQQIWPTVQWANQTIAAHGRVMKNMIGFADKSKPFKKTPKGTVQRRAVLRDYEEEIDAIYAKEPGEDLDHHLPERLDYDSVTEYIRQVIQHVLGKPEIENTQDFYAIGLDSLMTIQVARVLQRSIQLRRPDVKAGAIDAQKIYGNSTVNGLSQGVINILDGKSQGGIPRAEKIQSLVERYTLDLPTREFDPQTGLDSPSIVILTGSTGSLGTYLLHSLMNSESITKVYCLNRSDAESRQKQGFENKGLHLDANEWKDKVEFLQASFGEERFGLSESKYQELLDSVDTIIHNAWKVDFNHSVDSFEDTHIQGVRRFVDFSLASHHNAHLHFISSISTVGGWTPEMGRSIPEVPLEDSAVALQQGYGESKHIAERICHEASRRSQVPTTVYRVGQVAGPTSTRGQWNPQEWLPTIIATSKAMGTIPNRLGSAMVDWVPVDTLSNIIVEIVNTRHRSSSEAAWAVFHLANPELAPWSSLIPVIQSKYAVEPVDLAAWIAELESIPNPNSADIISKPALKLLSFYRGLQDENNALSVGTVGLDVRRAQKASVSMRALEPISASLMHNWLQQWDF